MKNSYLITILLMLAFLFSADRSYSQNKVRQFYLFSGEDIRTIKESSTSEWGKLIVKGLRDKIKDREKYTLDVPQTGGGYIHNYFCPVHNIEFSFDWNSPRAHYCEAGKKTWKDNKKFDDAWIAIAHGKNLEYLMSNMYLYLITDSSVYAKNIKKIMLKYSARYPFYIEHNRDKIAADRYSGKMYSQSLDEAVWAIDAVRAYDVAKSVMSEKERNSIETGYLSECAQMLMRKRVDGNWQAWHNGAIAALGVALRNDSILNIAINDPDYGYRSLLKKNVYKDGWWKEGSVVYHFYPLRALVLTAEAARCRGINLYDKELLKMFVAPVQMMYADLTFPSQNDGWYGTSLVSQTNLYELANLRYKEPILINVLSHCYRNAPRSAPEALMNGTELIRNPSPLNLNSCVFGDLGVGILRSRDKTVILKYGPDGGVHGHPDKLSITIHNGSREILPDFGTTAYSLPINGQWYKNTFAHNTVTVDKKNQLKSSGELTEFKAFKNGGIIAASADEAYPGVCMDRKLELKGKLLTDHFQCLSYSNHIYDYMLMLPYPCNFKNSRDTTLLEYEPIQKLAYSEGNNPLIISFEGLILKIEVPEKSDFEVFTGVAPGIPFLNAKLAGQHSYPLIIRMNGKKLDIKTTWTLVNDAPPSAKK